MGFWDVVKKGIKYIPGVGPVAEDMISIAGDVASNVGRTTGAASEGAANTRQTDAQINQGRDRNLLNRAGLQVDQNQTRDAQAMQRAQLGIDAPMARTKQAAYGDALSNVQDVNIDFQPTTGALPKFGVTGGLRPSLFGANARQAGGELGRQALMALMTKSDVPTASEAVAMPELSAPTKPGGLENVLDKVGLAGSIWGAIDEGIKKRREPIATMPKKTEFDWTTYK